MLWLRLHRNGYKLEMQLKARNNGLKQFLLLVIIVTDTKSCALNPVAEVWQAGNRKML